MLAKVLIEGFWTAALFGAVIVVVAFLNDLADPDVAWVVLAILMAGAFLTLALLALL